MSIKNMHKVKKTGFQMSIEQRLERIEQTFLKIEQIQQEILKFIRPDSARVVAPIKGDSSRRRQEALAKAAHYADLKEKRAAKKSGSDAAPVEVLTPLLGLDR